jgi:hypothetical protein
MRRREFIMPLGGTAWVPLSRANQPIEGTPRLSKSS